MLGYGQTLIVTHRGQAQDSGQLVRPLYLSDIATPGHPSPTATPTATMPIQTIEPRRLYRQIADQLRLLIEAGEFPVGARLPPERDLALKLGVSRPSVREALIADRKSVV